MRFILGNCCAVHWQIVPRARRAFVKCTIVVLMQATAAIAITPSGSAEVNADGPATPEALQYQVGAGPNASAILPTDQIIHPAGRLVHFFGRPNAIAICPSSRTAVAAKTAGNPVALNASGDLSTGPLLVLDLASDSAARIFTVQYCELVVQCARL